MTESQSYKFNVMKSITRPEYTCYSSIMQDTQTSTFSKGKQKRSNNFICLDMMYDLFDIFTTISVEMNLNQSAGTSSEGPQAAGIETFLFSKSSAAS